MLDIFGLNPWASEWAGAADQASDDLTGVVDELVSTLLTQRADARARKDWGSRRDPRLAGAAGLKITDTQHGARWSLERS